MLTVATGVRLRAITIKNETIALLAAEAGYEKAVFWMSQQPDMLSSLEKGASGISGAVNLPNSNCNYSIHFFTFLGSRPIYKVTSTGYGGSSSRTVDVLVLQEIGGWESPHRVPSGPSSSVSWPFTSSEVIDMPMHVNKHDDSPDVRDIYISGSPDFRQRVSIGESRYAGGADKYADVINLFDDGIYFDQPDSKISQKSVVQEKIDRFEDTTKSSFIFTPKNMDSSGTIKNPHPAVQLEFLGGMVRITNNCTVRGYQGDDGTYDTYDYKLSDGSSLYTKYDIYGYHLRPTDPKPNWIPLEDTYVQQSFSGVQAEPGGQIFVDGDVIIGGLYIRQVVKGKIVIAATGNIWIADSVVVDGARDGDMPAMNNPNALGLIAQGVIKVVDPGMSEYCYDVDDGRPIESGDFEYVPIGIGEEHNRRLLNPMVLEAAITVGGGGWGAENVGNRKTSGSYDRLIVRGSITEAMRGIVGTFPPLWNPNPSNGYSKYYYFDERLLCGVLPGYIWFKGKYVPAPAGWHDYRSSI